MSAAPRGTLLLNTASLPSWSHIDAPTQSDSEDARIRLLYQSALRAHWLAAAAKVSKGSEISEEERAESRRLLCSNAEPWLSWRRFLADNAELDQRAIRRAAIEMLAPIIAREAEEDERHVETPEERKARENYLAKIERQKAERAEPAKPKPQRITLAESARHASQCRAAQIAARDPAKAFQTVLDNEDALSETEISAALDHAAALELAAHDRAERRRIRKRAARARYRQRMAQKDSVPALAAE